VQCWLFTAKEVEQKILHAIIRDDKRREMLMIQCGHRVILLAIFLSTIIMLFLFIVNLFTTFFIDAKKGATSSRAILSSSVVATITAF